MATPPVNVNALGAAAMDALRRGDARTAQRQFLQIVSTGSASNAVLIGLAWACQALRDERGMNLALDRALAQDPRDLRALLLRADTLAAKGDVRAALSFYGVIVGLHPNPEALPPDAAKEVRRAQAAQAQLGSRVFAHMKAALATSGYDEAKASARFTQSLAMLAGTAKRYEQEPRSYFFPELPTIGFYPREQFPWLDAIEAATPEICDELQGLLNGPNVFAPYIEAEENRPTDRSHSLLDSQDWTACYLWKDGVPVPDIAARCPRTMRALHAAPLERVKGRAPFALFSKLTPGAWIRPHTGFLNTRLICHLPLIVPKDCRLRVGHETRHWEKGRAWVFNDTIEHEARNESAETRIVLIFNIWRPEMKDDERGLVATLLESIDSA